MRIAILSDDFPPTSFGGAGIVAGTQAKEFVKRGHDVTVITTSQKKEEAGKEILDGVTIYKIYAKYPLRWRSYISMYNPQTVSKVKKILKEIKPDIVHVHNIHIYLSYKVFDFAKRYGKKVFLTAHDTLTFNYGKLYPKINTSISGEIMLDYKISAWSLLRHYKFWWNPIRNIVIRHYLKNVDTIISCCYALQEALKQNGIKNTVMMHNGINPKDFFANNEQIANFKNKYALQGKKILFFAGRISRGKGGDAAIDLLIDVAKTIPEICLMIAGKEDAYVQGLMKIADKTGVKDNIRLLGWLDRETIISAYFASDVVLVLSMYLDNNPLINIEAMSAKKPIVATCINASREAVIDGETGFIVNPKDISSVTPKVLSLLKNEGLAEKFGQAGYERVLKDFSLSQQIDKLEKLYDV